MKEATCRKAYKENVINIIRIFPGDLTGSPDDFFLGDYLNLKGSL